jgi:hypothetical protein
VANLTAASATAGVSSNTKLSPTFGTFSGHFRGCVQQGSMLWSQFSAISAKFRRKKWRFSQKSPRSAGLRPVFNLAPWAELWPPGVKLGSRGKF